jgi:hypothetical protein
MINTDPSGENQLFDGLIPAQTPLMPIEEPRGCGGLWEGRDVEDLSLCMRTLCGIALEWEILTSLVRRQGLSDRLRSLIDKTRI